MKDDTISRAAALTALNGCTEIYLNNLPPTIYKTDAVEAVKALPSATDTNVGGNLIDRGAALDALERLDGMDGIPQHFMITRKSVRNMLKALPSAQPGWIPVTERLPQNGYWIWSANGGEVKKDFYWDGHWELAEKYGYEVLAWMPLPKPWEGEKDDG